LKKIEIKIPGSSKKQVSKSEFYLQILTAGMIKKEQKKNQQLIVWLEPSINIQAKKKELRLF
jgi:hypothetical protein